MFEHMGVCLDAQAQTQMPEQMSKCLGRAPDAWAYAERPGQMPRRLGICPDAWAYDQMPEKTILWLVEDGFGITSLPK